MTARILLVEDDPITRAVLAAAVASLPADVDAVASAAEARERVGAARYDLALVDAHLPDGDGGSLLAALRTLGFAGPALAHTASNAPELLGRLRHQGFARVLVKPLAAAALLAAVAQALGHTPRRVADGDPAWPPAGVPPVWDDVAALAALRGERGHVAALRQLFTDELPAAVRRIDNAVRAADRAALRDALHRLRASCGFVGAARLAAAVAALDAAPEPAAALPAFLAAAQETASPG